MRLFEQAVRSLMVESSKGKIVKELEGLSDSLLAVKFEVVAFEEIEAVRERLVAWAKDNFEAEWVNWLDAVEAFKSGRSASAIPPPGEEVDEEEGGTLDPEGEEEEGGEKKPPKKSDKKTAKKKKGKDDGDD